MIMIGEYVTLWVETGSSETSFIVRDSGGRNKKDTRLTSRDSNWAWHEYYMRELTVHPRAGLYGHK
jgi:hypothetical protein